MIATAAQNGLGRRDTHVTRQDWTTARHLIFASMSLWIVCIAFVRISIACMLLRLKHSQPWRIFLWTLIGVQLLSCVANFIFQMVQCNPLAFLWDPEDHPTAVCVKQISDQANMYVHSGIGTATDFMLATVPIFFMRESRRSRRDLIMLWCMVALGLFAASSSIVKMLRTSSTIPAKDALYTATDTVLWSFLEQQTGIIAACIPSLGPLFTRMKERWSGTSAIARSSDYDTALKLNHTRTDSGFSAFRRLTLTPTPIPFTLDLILPNPSTTTTHSMLHHPLDAIHNQGPVVTPKSSRTVWPIGSSGTSSTDHTPLPTTRLSEDAYEQMLAEGGILMTTEFQIKSEGVSRVGSPDGAMETERRREMEEWRVERPSTEMKMRGWDVV
jgi:hypothetical protein